LILSDQGIRKALASGDLEIDPTPADDQYTTSSVDLTLGSVFQVWDKSRLDVDGVHVELDLADQKYVQTSNAFIVPATVDSNGCCILPPYHKEPRLLLAITRERIHLAPGSRLAARVEGRSSFARLGLMVHLTAPTIQHGFRGTITLEILNHGPFYVKFVPTRTRICQLIVERLESDPTVEIDTQFQDQISPSGKKAPSHQKATELRRNRPDSPGPSRKPNYRKRKRRRKLPKRSAPKRK
jgi:dCTP deaminase